MSDETPEPREPAKSEPAKQPKAKKAAGKSATAKKAAKDKGAKGKKSAGKKGQPEATSQGPSVAHHPRAGSHVRRAKGWGGLAGFAIAGYLSLQAGVPTYDIGIRALVAGAAGYLLAWACSITVWKHLVLAELRVAAERRAPEPADGPRSGDGKPAS